MEITAAALSGMPEHDVVCVDQAPYIALDLNVFLKVLLLQADLAPRAIAMATCQYCSDTMASAGAKSADAPVQVAVVTAFVGASPGYK